VNSEGEWSPQQLPAHGHWPPASRVCGFQQILAIVVALRGRAHLPKPSKTLAMVGNVMEMALDVVLWWEGSVPPPQLAIRSYLQKQKKSTRLKEEKKNELQQNVRVKFKTL